MKFRIKEFKLSSRFTKVAKEDIEALNLLYNKGIRESILKVYQELESKKVKITYTDLKYRFNQFLKKEYLDMYLYYDLNLLGLEEIITIFKIYPCQTKAFEEILDSNPYVTGLLRGIAGENTYVVQSFVPLENKKEFEEFMHLIKNSKIVKSSKDYSVEENIGKSVGFDWYDYKKGTSIFNWEELVKDITSKKYVGEYKTTLKYLYPYDETDIKLLEFLHQNPLIKFKEISEKIKVSIPLIKYHYSKHIIPSKILINFIYLLPYGKEDIKNLSYLFAIFNFESYEYRNMFIEAVKTKPFIYSMATIKNAPVVCSFLIIPHRELKNLVRTLIILSENRFLSDFEIVDIDIVNSKTKYIPFDLYKGKWTYPHEEIINKTKEILLRIK
jgi:hypothetical protein